MYVERQKLASDFASYLPDIRTDANRKQISFAGALNRWSPGPTDALIETMDRRGVIAQSSDWGASTTVSELMDDESNFALGVAYLQEVFRSPLTGMDRYPVSLKGMDMDHAQEFAVDSAGELPRAWEPYDVGVPEFEKPVLPRPSLAQIIGMREFVRSANYTTTVFEEESEESDYTQNIAPGADIPVVGVTADGKTVKLDKKAYALKFPIEVFMMNNTSIQTIAQFQRWRAYMLEDAIVDEALIALEAVAPNATSLTGGVTNENLATMHTLPDTASQANLNVVIGDQSSIRQYIGGSVHTAPGRLGSGSDLIVPSRRMWVDSVVGRVILSWKSGIVDKGGSAARYLIFDNSKCLKQLIQTGGDMSETVRDNMSHSEVMTNSFLYKVEPTAAAPKAAFDQSFGT